MSGWRRPLLGVGLALLYLGVVATGMALPFPSALALATAGLLGYNLIMRPAKDWAPNPPAFVLSLLVLAASAALLVGLGGLLRGVTGPLPPASGALMMGLGIALPRLVSSPAKAAEMDSFLDDALTQLTEMARETPPQPTPSRTLPDLDAPQIAKLAELRAGLTELPAEADARSAALDQMLAPLGRDWPALISHLNRPEHPQEIEAAAHLLLSNDILPQAFGHPDAGEILNEVFLRHPMPVTEAAARRALAMDLDRAEAWRLLPGHEALAEQARLLDDPPALTALASLMAEREAEDAARLD